MKRIFNQKVLRSIATLTVLIAFMCLATGCEPLEPEESNVYDIDDVRSVVTYAEGFLVHAYLNIPSAHNTFPLAYASDDAVTNNPSSNVKAVVRGGWASDQNPFSVWNVNYENILYLNTFFEEVADIEWYWKNKTTNELFSEKLKGEAYALRAWNYFLLLQAHAGPGKDGGMLGVPIVDHVLDANDPADYQVPRSTFNELVAFILSDCDKAISMLPSRWVDAGDFVIDDAIGERNTNRINGLVARLIKVKTLLYAASPAYSDGTYTYQMAAEAAAGLMNENGGLDNVSSAHNDHLKFYNNEDVASDNLHPEVFWYSSRTNGNNWEKTNYPPSLYGNGSTNPSQELVDAFPMLDGSPASETTIDPGNPYAGRDPRLATYILYDGATVSMGGKTLTINTRTGNQDAPGSTDINASTTGYYLRKFMNFQNVDLDPSINSQGTRYYTFARYTDALLMFAEAANMAAGPDGMIGGYSARQVINAIRDRAGITSSAYADGLDQEGLAGLIRNERRIELCFEGERFWDLRRWMLTDKMKQPVSGVRISADGLTRTYPVVETREFADYQIYGPIPFGETLKYKLVQNKGWR